MQKLVLTKIGVLNGFFLKKNKVSGIYFLLVLATSAFRTEGREQKRGYRLLIDTFRIDCKGKG